MGELRFRATVKHDGAEVGDLPWLEEFWAVRYDDYAALQARVAELGRELNQAKYGQPDFAWSVHKQALADAVERAEAAEALLSEAVKAGMLECAKAVHNPYDAKLIQALSSDPETIARIVAQVKEGRG